MNTKKPILVTGAHRSGTTWVGRMIAASPSVYYIYEPFNPNHSLGICGARFNYWFTYITAENETTVYKHIRKTINFSYNLASEMLKIRDLENARRILIEYRNFQKYRNTNVRPLLKDPIAVFSAEWLVSRFNMDIVVTIRHPAAFASSLKRKNWTHPFSHFLAQPLLMRDYLNPFAAEIREYANREHDIIDQAALLWRLIYYVVAEYRKRHADWLFMRHEDLSRDPQGGFKKIFEYLNLEFTPDVQRTVEEYTDSSNPGEVGGSTESLKRNSELNIWNWKKRLTQSEIERIRAKVEDVASMFYDNEDW